MKSLPDEVGMLLHLRYLCLTEAGWITNLPETVCDSLNLQTLGLNGCGSLRSLPKRMGELYNLRHLELKETWSLVTLPEGIWKLSHLRTLIKFIVGAEVNGLKIKGLKLLRHLQGDLQITGLGNIVELDEVSKAELKMKKNLRMLTLKFDHSIIQDFYIKKMEIVLRDLEPPSGLKDLVIHDYPGRRFPFWIPSLSNLISLELNRFNGCVYLPCLGKLPSLKKLSLKSSISVKSLGMDFYGVVSKCDNKDIFPRLEELHFQDMPNFSEWEFPSLKNRSIMPRLSVLSIISCPKINQLPFLAHEDVFPDLKELYIEGCSFQLLVGVGKLKSLIELGIENLKGLENMDTGESWSFVLDDEGESWSLPFENDINVFNSLSEVHIVSCQILGALPALGGLKLKYFQIQSQVPHHN